MTLPQLLALPPRAQERALERIDNVDLLRDWRLALPDREVDLRMSIARRTLEIVATWPAEDRVARALEGLVAASLAVPAADVREAFADLARNRKERTE